MPPGSLDCCTCAALRRAARHLTQAYDRGLAPTGLRTSQYSLLHHIAAAGPRTIQDLAREMGLDRTTLGRNIQPLEREGLLTQYIDPNDRRGRRLQVTPVGKQRLAEAARLWAATQASFAAAYGSDRAEVLHAILDDLARIEIG